MRFISPFPRFRLICKHQKIEILASGLPRVLEDGYTAEFRNTDVTDWERDLARETFTFRGTVTDEGGRDVDPVKTRVSTFDTSKIGDEKLRGEVERFMINHPDHGRDFIVAERPKAAPPWPTYDSVHPSKIAAKVKEDGFDPQAVIAYERENKNRASVISALEALREGEPEEELVAA